MNLMFMEIEKWITAPFFIPAQGITQRIDTCE